MVKVKYVGDMSPVKIKVNNSFFYFEKGEIKDIDDESVKKLTLNKDYVRVEDNKVEARKHIKEDKIKVEPKKELDKHSNKNEEED